MSRTIEVLSPAGHLLLTWDPAIPASVERARAEFDALVAAGYQFFRVEGGAPETGFSSEAGALVVKRVAAAEIAPAIASAPPLDQPAGTAATDQPTRRRGRPPKQAAPTQQPAERIVATRPLRGG